MKTFWLILLLASSALACHAAVHFDGANDHITFPDINAIDSKAAITVSCLIKQDVLTANQCFVGKYDTTNGVGLFFQTGATSKSNLLFAVSGTSYVTTTTGGFHTAGVWFHVCGVFDNTATPKHKIYINGILQATANTGTPDSITSTGDSANIFTVGRISATVNKYWLGSVDDLKVFDRALSAQEVYSDAGGTRDVVARDGLISYWPLDDNANGTVLSSLIIMDRAGGNHGLGANGLTAVAGILSIP